MEDGTTQLLVDCGTTKKRMVDGLAKIGVQLQELDAVLITHTHNDHIAGIKFFKVFPIYSPVEIDGLDVFIVEADCSFAIESLQIMPIALSHDAGKTLGYVFDNGLERLLYLTDTGYLNEKYIPFLKGMDYIILESNHDVNMLMKTNRPYVLKRRILDDEGHLSNESCASILEKIVTENTKSIWLAHLSQEANSPEIALNCSLDRLRHVLTNPNLKIAAAQQYESLWKGENDEEMDFGQYCSTVSLESHS